MEQEKIKERYLNFMRGFLLDEIGLNLKQNSKREKLQQRYNFGNSFVRGYNAVENILSFKNVRNGSNSPLPGIPKSILSKLYGISPVSIVALYSAVDCLYRKDLFRPDIFNLSPQQQIEILLSHTYKKYKKAIRQLKHPDFSPVIGNLNLQEIKEIDIGNLEAKTLKMNFLLNHSPAKEITGILIQEEKKDRNKPLFLAYETALSQLEEKMNQ